jgi:hypothetical protein
MQYTLTSKELPTERVLLYGDGTFVVGEIVVVGGRQFWRTTCHHIHPLTDFPYWMRLEKPNAGS